MNDITYAAKTLPDKMYRIYESKEYREVWSLSFTHRMLYHGENWEKEFEELKALVEAELKKEENGK